jgi:hypothetical protein
LPATVALRRVSQLIFSDANLGPAVLESLTELETARRVLSALLE